MKKKILVFNGYYLPAKNYGGPTTSLANIVKYCSDDFEFFIIAANHDLNDSRVFNNIHDGWNKVGNANVLYLDTTPLKKDVKQVEKIICKVQPDMVWLVGILTPSHWVQATACRNLGVPYLISPRGEVCNNTFHMKYGKKKLASLYVRMMNKYRGAYYHATSEEEKDGLIRYYGVNPNRIIFVSNIPKAIAAEKRSIEKKTGELKLVFISRVQEKKNLLTAIKAVNSMNGDVEFDIYGPIEGVEYWEECQKEISNCDNIKIQYRGQLKPDQVIQTYKQYHAFLFPTKSENYGHAIAEALSVSCPVVLSRGTTPWDDLDGVGGFVCGLYEIDEYANALKCIQKMDQDQYNQLMRTTREYYNQKMESDDSIVGHKQMLMKVIEQ